MDLSAWVSVGSLVGMVVGATAFVMNAKGNAERVNDRVTRLETDLEKTASRLSNEIVRHAESDLGAFAELKQTIREGFTELREDIRSLREERTGPIRRA